MAFNLNWMDSKATDLDAFFLNGTYSAHKGMRPANIAHPTSVQNHLKDDFNVDKPVSSNKGLEDREELARHDYEDMLAQNMSPTYRSAIAGHRHSFSDPPMHQESHDSNFTGIGSTRITNLPSVNGRPSSGFIQGDGEFGKFGSSARRKSVQRSQRQTTPSSSDTNDSEDRTYHEGNSSSESITAQGSLEARFEEVMDAIEAAGFDGIDVLATEYYTATFKENTTLQSAQSQSRFRHLRSFLEALNASTKNWESREVWGYREQILRSARSIFLEELSETQTNKMAADGSLITPKQSPIARKTTPSENWRGSSYITERLRQVFLDPEMNHFLKQEMRGLREGVCCFPSAFPISFTVQLVYFVDLELKRMWMSD